MAKKNKRVERKTQQKRMIPAWIWMVMGSFMTLMIGAFLYLWQPFKSLDNKPDPQDGYTEKPTTKKEEFKDTVKSQSEKTAEEKPAQAVKDDTKNVTDKKTDQEDYEFYEILPEQELTPIPDDVVDLQPEDNKPKVGKSDVTIKTDKLNKFETYDGGEAIDEWQDTENKNKTNAKNNDAKVNDPIEELLTGKKSNFILQINSYGSAEEADKRRAEVLLAGIDARVIKTPLDGDSYLYQVISNEYQTREDVFTAQERLKSSGIDSIIVERKQK